MIVPGNASLFRLLGRVTLWLPFHYVSKMGAFHTVVTPQCRVRPRVS